MERTIQINKSGITYEITGNYTSGRDGSYLDPPEPAEFEPTSIRFHNKHDFVDELVNVTPIFDSFDLWGDIEDLINEQVKDL